MGSLCSSTSSTYGAGQVLGSGSSSNAGYHRQPPEAPSTGRQPPGRVPPSYGGAGGNSQGGADKRAALAEAAERRQEAERARGTQASNPNKGQLAAKLEASKKSPLKKEEEMPERLVYE